MVTIRTLLKLGLVVKGENLEEATEFFKDTGVSITMEGRHLGAAVGTQTFVESFVQQKVSEWICAVERLSSIALTQPHAAYAAFTHGLVGKWTYLTRTIPDIEDLLQPLENAIRQKFLTCLTGQIAFNDVTRDVMALPVWLDGFGNTNPSSQTSSHYNTSLRITAPLATLILQQSHEYPPATKDEPIRVKNEARKIRRQHESIAATELKDKLQRKGGQAGYLLFLSWSMVLHCTKVPSETLFV